ncbi:hypothetical protein AB0F13_24560 [Streptomyces sp. NPDC026206]|uniref:hypothetical protein n=1 Tax=Streptomyces sp. NPDC026206 TaxID=3157089 RepID=UPI0033DCA82D
MTAPRHALRVIKKSARIALRRSPVMKVGATVRRRAASGLASGRNTLVDSVLMPAAHGSAARVQYAAVLDGHTLNLHAALPAGTEAAEDPAARAHLLLVNGDTRLRAEARLQRDEAGRMTVAATVLLGEEIGGLPVTTGRWTLGLELRDDDPAPVRLRLLGDGPPDYAGPTRPLATCPRTGRRHRLGLTTAGQLRLTVAPAQARAEILRIDRSFTGAGLLFAVYGQAVTGDGAGQPVVELVDQQRRQVLRQAVEPLPGDDTAWRVTLPLARLLATTSGRQTWSFRLVPGSRGAKPLDLGRHDHDLTAPRKVLTPPAFTVRAENGTFVQVKPQYTRRGALQLVCTPRSLGTT